MIRFKLETLKTDFTRTYHQLKLFKRHLCHHSYPWMKFCAASASPEQMRSVPVQSGAAVPWVAVPLFVLSALFACAQSQKCRKASLAQQGPRQGLIQKDSNSDTEY